MTDERRLTLRWIASENAHNRRPMFLGATMAMVQSLKRDGLILWDRGWYLTTKGSSELASARVA